MKSTLLVTAGTVAIIAVLSTIRLIRQPTLASVLQLLGSAFLVIMVLTHIAEAFSLVPQMGWGQPNTAGHYLDLVSAIGGLVLLVAGVSLRAFGTGSKIT